MDAFLNAIMGDIANRVVAFLMAKCSKVFTTPTTEGKGLSDLQRLLLRVRVIIEEAEGRHITNPMIAYQLNMLRKEMYRGYFTLDRLRIHGQEQLKAKDLDVSNYFTLSKFNPAKRFFFTTGNTHMEKDLQQVLDNVNNIMVTMSEFVAIFNNYPPLYRQPYSMHLYIGNCMFGRQMEMDRVIDFLMQIANPSMKNVGVLPIVGPTNVGKSTLVAYVHNDERVRNHFSKILVISGDEINNESPMSMLNDRGVIVYQDNTLRKNDRLLTIIEFSRDDVVDQVIWNSLYSSACACLGSGSKIIMTSTSDEIIKFGTTQALVLNFLSQEAYWYFFKIITFGSTDSGDHPELESIGMEMARWMNGSFIGANFNSGHLSKNLIAEYWQMHLAFFKDNIQRNVSVFGKNQFALTKENKPMSFLIRNKYEFTIYSHYSASLAEDDVPVITMYDVLTGGVKCEGELQVLIWKSHILPFKYYVANCIIEKL